MPHLHDKYVVVPADKAPNDIVFVRKSHYTDRLIKELGIGNSLGNPTYTPTTLTEVEILDKHMSVLCSFVISTTDEELDLPLLYWIPKLHKCPRLQTTLYCWVCQMLHETSFQYINLFYQPSKPDCDTSYSRSGVNQMWILKNSKDLIEYIQSKPLLFRQ